MITNVVPKANAYPFSGHLCSEQKQVNDYVRDKNAKHQYSLWLWL